MRIAGGCTRLLAAAVVVAIVAKLVRRQPVDNIGRLDVNWSRDCFRGVVVEGLCAWEVEVAFGGEVGRCCRRDMAKF